MKVIVWRKLF